MNLLWLDVETTGLDPQKETILELAFATAPLERPMETTPIHTAVLKFPVEERAKLSPFVLDMHTENGLLDACAKSPTVLADVEEWLLAVVPEIADKEEMTVIAGSTISFDLSFLRVHMPKLAKRLSYRHFDVSAIKFFCRSLGMPKPPKAEAHRAAADVRESIDHLKVCIDWLRSRGLTLPVGP